MKKQIAIAMGLAVLSTGALASKARLQALGEDTFGSFHIDDARNVVMNPALLNLHKDFVTMEWGTNSATGATDQDGAANPKAEGGMFKASGNMIYGLYFGDESNTANALRAASMGAGVVDETNNTSFYVAGDAGVQWGVKLTYHDFKNKQGANDVKSTAARANIGINTGDIESFLSVGLINEAENGSTAEFKGKGSYQLGVTYNRNEIDYMLEVRAITVEDADGEEYSANFTRLGVAKAYKLNDKAQVWTSAWYKMDNSKSELTNNNVGEVKDTYLPVTIAMEVMAKDWLTLRGSVTNEIIGTNENDAGDETTRDNKATVAAGASLLFGDLTIDGMIGNSDNNTTVGESTAGGNGTLRTDALMSRVSMTYKF